MDSVQRLSKSTGHDVLDTTPRSSHELHKEVGYELSLDVDELRSSQLGNIKTASANSNDRDKCMKP